MSHPVRKSGERYTYRDLLTWPEDERWELIDGVAYDMTPAPGTAHQGISAALTALFVNLLEGNPCRVYAAPLDVLLPKGNEADENIDTVVQPDLVVVCDRSKITELGIRGAPDLVVEILSPSTGQKDMTEKMRLYEQTAVREYWIVDPTHRTVMVFRLGENGLYGRPDTYTAANQIPVGVLDGLTIDLQRVFAEEETEPAQDAD